jgi:threonine dehydratase
MSAGVPDVVLLDEAQRLVAQHLPPTPVVSWSSAGHGDVLLKLETLQPSGAFKVRGALSALSAYGGDPGGVVTASAGNHALGVAEAARMLGSHATIVVPENASAAKVEALRRYPVDLRLVGCGYDEAEREALRLADETGGTYVSAYNDARVIAGQSSVVAEVARQVDGPVTVVVPVGGGGLVAGSALEAARHDGRIRVVGVESDASTAVSAAVRAGRTVHVPVGETICDGLAGNIEDACVTPDVVRDSGTRLVSVNEGSVRTAVRDLAVHAGLVVEGASAVTLAALVAGLVPRDRAVLLVLTGRNIAPALLTELLARGS